MNTLLFGASRELANELLLRLRCRWEDAHVTLAARLDDVADDLESVDLVFIDIAALPDRYAGLMREIGALWPGPLVAISREALGVETQVAALRAGADDVWPEFPADTILFIARTHALLRRAVGGEHLRVGRLTLIRDAQEARLDGRWPLALTPTEFRLLYKLAVNRNHIVQLESLIDEVWSGEAIGRSAARKLVQRLRGKLGERAGVEIVTHPGVGYSLRRAESPAAPLVHAMEPFQLSVSEA